MSSASPPEDSISGLRRLLNAWDPIGVAEIAPDGYDCLISPLPERLHSCADRVELREYLRHELTDHFGLTPISVETDAIADNLIGWWTAPQLQSQKNAPSRSSADKNKNP